MRLFPGRRSRWSAASSRICAPMGKTIKARAQGPAPSRRERRRVQLVGSWAACCRGGGERRRFGFRRRRVGVWGKHGDRRREQGNRHCASTADQEELGRRVGLGRGGGTGAAVGGGERRRAVRVRHGTHPAGSGEGQARGQADQGRTGCHGAAAKTRRGREEEEKATEGRDPAFATDIELRVQEKLGARGQSSAALLFRCKRGAQTGLLSALVFPPVFASGSRVRLTDAEPRRCRQGSRRIAL